MVAREALDLEIQVRILARQQFELEITMKNVRKFKNGKRKTKNSRKRTKREGS